MNATIPARRYVELVTERTVQRFLLRLFLRETKLRGLYIVAPFIATLSKSRFSLRDLREKIDREQILTYVITREPAEQYQQEAMQLLSGCRWVEIRYNDSIHAKLYVADALRDADSFALFGSGNLTAKSIESNIELAMLVYSEGHGRDILRDLQYWASVRLRTLNESKLIQPIRGKRS